MPVEAGGSIKSSYTALKDPEDDVIDVLVNRYLGRVSGLRLLSGSFAILSVLSVLLTCVLLVSAAGGVVQRILQKTADQAQQATQSELEHFLKAPDILLNYVEDAVVNEYVDSDDVESLQSLLWNTPGRGDQIAFSSIYYSTPKGELIGLGSRNLDWPLLDWTFSLSTAETDGNYTIVDPTRDGKLSESRVERGKFDARQRPWFKAASAASNGAAVWSDLYADFESGKLSLSRTQAIVDNNGQVRGVAGVDMHLRHIQNFLQALPLSANGEMFLVDSRGVLLASHAPHAEFYAADQGGYIQESNLRFSTLAARHVIQEFGGFENINAPYRRYLTLNGEKGYLLVAPISRERGLTWSLGIFLPESDYLGSVAALAMRLVPMIILIIVTGCAIVTGFLYLIVRPGKQLIETALRISRGEFDADIALDSRNEIGQLARAIHLMRQRLKRSFSELEKQKRLAETTLNSIADGVLAINADREITYVNPVACKLLGAELHNVAGKCIDTVLLATEFATGKPLATECFADALAARQGFNKELVLTDSNGVNHPVYCRFSIIAPDSDESTGAVATLSDLTEEQRLKSELIYQATHDDLTQLSNRRWFEQRLQELIVSAANGSETHALCYIDLDQFKVVNDSSGHQAGDELLRQIANLLHRELLPKDSLARLGGDEFGVLIEHATLYEAEAVIEQMRSSVDNFRFSWKERSFSLGMSAGIVPIDMSTTSVVTAMRDADNACYIAKDAGRNRIHVTHTDNHSLSNCLARFGA